MTLLLHILGHLVTAMTVLLAVMMLGLATPSARVVELDADEALRRFEAATGRLPEALYRDQVVLFTDLIQQTTDAFAAREGVIVVEADLALSGAVDVTDRIVTEALAHLAAPDLDPDALRVSERGAQ